MTTTGTLYGVGLGPGDPGLLTLRAVEVLQRVETIFHVAGPRSRESISRRIVESVDGCRDKCRELVFSMSTHAGRRAASVRAAAATVAAELEQGRACAFATIGDPLVYSTFGYLQRDVRDALPDVHIDIVPGITAFQAAAAQSGEPLVEDREILTVIPRWQEDDRQNAAIDAADTVVALKTYRERNAALGVLQRRMTPGRVVYAVRVGQEQEYMETCPETIVRQPIDYLSLLIATRSRAHD